MLGLEVVEQANHLLATRREQPFMGRLPGWGELDPLTVVRADAGPLGQRREWATPSKNKPRSS